MNKIQGIISNIQQSGAILLVDIDVDGQTFSALLIEAASKPLWLEVGRKIELIFKETEVTLAKNLTGIISMRNRMMCTVTKVERGDLLTAITLLFGRYTIVSAITTRSADILQLNVADEIEALVKANEISLTKLN